MEVFCPYFLWNVVCDDILASVLPKDVHIQVFADDISLVKTGIRMEWMQAPLQKASDIVLEWAFKHFLEISAEKTKLIVFGSQR